MTMKPVGESPPVKRSDEDWVPLMELAPREVFDLMLGCQLTKPEIAIEGAFDPTSMVGLAGRRESDCVCRNFQNHIETQNKDRSACNRRDL
jgi:hypothetical protein